MSDQTFGDSTGSADALGAGPGGTAVPHAQPVNAAEFVEGAPAPYDLYVVHGFYEDVIDLDGSTVNIERAYPQDRYATGLAVGERGNVLLAAGTPVPADVVALLST